MRLTRTVTLAALTIAAPALAGEDDEYFRGKPCETSRDCGALKCINERCHDVAAILRGEDTSVSMSTPGHVAMFGDGQGYGGLVAAADIAATATEPFLMLATMSTQAPITTLLGVLCFVPTGLTGPIVHAVHGRYVPAVISFFAWTSLAGSTFVVGGLFGLAFETNGFELNTAAAWAAGLVFGASGAAMLTWLDVWMARTIEPPEKKSSTFVRLVPTFVPARGGGMAALGGSF